MELRMYYVGNSDRGAIADSFACRAYVLDWIRRGEHKIRRCFNGMFSPADSASALLQIIGVDSRNAGILTIAQRKSGQRRKFHEFTHNSGFVPFQVFCYEDEAPVIESLLDELAEKFPFDADATERGDAGDGESVASLSSYDSPLSREAYLSYLESQAPDLRQRLLSAFPAAIGNAMGAVEKASRISFDSMSESEIRKVAGELVAGRVSFDDFECGISAREPEDNVLGEMRVKMGSRYLLSAIATWTALADEKHVVEGLRNVMEDPVLVLASMFCSEKDLRDDINAVLAQDSMLRGYMATYIQSILFAFRCVKLSYDDYLYDLYAARMWELFALCGKDHVRGGYYENLARIGMQRLGYPTSEKTLGDVIQKLHMNLINDRSDD